LKGHKDSIPSISYFPDGKRIISRSDDETTRQWDLEAGKEIREAWDVCEQEVHAVGVSRDGRWVVSAGGGVNSNTGELRVREVKTGIERTFEGPLRTITCIDISGDSTLLAGAEDYTVRIWSLETSKLVAAPFEGHTDIISGLALSLDCALLASAALDNTIKLW
ncbi:WD40 repeat-like protein, partial [Suillus decipiens]